MDRRHGSDDRQPILDAIDARNRQGIFGYTSRPDSYFEAVCQWQEKRNGWKPDPALCLYTLGVVPALCTFVREFSKPGDEISVHHPRLRRVLRLGGELGPPSA